MSGLILCGRVGKHTDELAAELVHSTQAKTDCKEWHTDGCAPRGAVCDWTDYGVVVFCKG